MNNWLICAGDKESALVESYLIGCGTSCSIQVETNPWKVRRMLKERPAAFGVIVGEQAQGISSINIAAAYVMDACAQEVVLVAKDASGSLRSRAKRAGIARVLSEYELGSAPIVRPPQRKKAEILSLVPQVIEEEPQEVPSSLVSYAQETAPDITVYPVNEAACLGLQKQGAEDELSRRTPRHAARLAPSGVCRREGVSVITFVSGRGGVGKTTICALAGYIAGSWGLRVALLDLDLAFGNLAALCGAEQSSDLAESVEGIGAQDSLACVRGIEVSENLEVFGPCRAPEYAELVQPYAARFIAALSQNHDLVLIDTTSNWGDAVAAAAQEADRVAIVADSRPGAISALTRCANLAVRLGVARGRIVRVINGCDPKERDREFVMRATTSFKCSREIQVLDGQIEAIELLALGNIKELIEVKNPLASSVATGLAQVLQELGKLPSDSKAQSALSTQRPKRFFERMRGGVAL